MYVTAPSRPAGMCASAYDQVQKASAVGSSPRYTTPAQFPADAWLRSVKSWPAKGRQATAPIVLAYAVICNGDAWDSAGFWKITPTA